ncbi:hypothetical protein ABIE48_003060 [Paenibacillus sp. OAE614]
MRRTGQYCRGILCLSERLKLEVQSLYAVSVISMESYWRVQLSQQKAPDLAMKKVIVYFRRKPTNRRYQNWYFRSV